MSRPVWMVELIKLAFPTRHQLARLTRLPVLGSLVDHLLFQGDDIIYLPRDNVIPVGRSIEDPGEMVLPGQVVDHFIERASYHWIMDDCLCRDASDCTEYPIELGCLFLGEAVLGINPQLGRPVGKAEALAHVYRCREAGLVHMVGRNKLDTAWLGVGPGDKLFTICNCCPCCCLWKMLPHIDPFIGDKVSRMPGVTVFVTEACMGCGTCTRGICFVDAISLEGQKAVISEACRGCGRCVEICPNQAIKLSVDDVQFVDATIQRLSAKVDVS